MSLRYALLASLLDGEATGYELAKRFDSSVANFWHALPQQLYQELARMEAEGVVEGELVVQQQRPNKRIFSITERGRQSLQSWLDEPARMASLKDTVLVKVYASDLAEPDEVIAWLDRCEAGHEAKLAHYEALRILMFHGRDEETFLRTTHRIGPYLTLKRGIDYERENIKWARWAKDVVRSRAAVASGV